MNNQSLNEDFDLSQLTTAEPRREPPKEEPRKGRDGFGKSLRDFLVGKMAAHFLWFALLPIFTNFVDIKEGVAAVCAFVATQRGYRLDKAPDTKAGGLVTKASGADAPKEEKRSFVEKAIDKVAAPAKVVFEPVKDAARRGVAKAEAKVEAVKEEATEIVADAKETAVEKVEEVKESVGKIGEKLAVQPNAPAATTPTPSLAERLQAKLPAVKPAQKVPRRKSRAEMVQDYWRAKNRIELGQIGGVINQGVNQAEAEYRMGERQQAEEFQRATSAANQTARRGRP